MAKRPNILFFLTDDLRYDCVHALGLNDQIKTPNLDKLFAESTTFRNAHIPGGTLAAVCMPSRAMINTGRNIFHLQEQGNSVPEEHPLLGETLERAGYFTFGTGKWHNGPRSYARSFDDGDEIFFGGMYDHWKVPTNHFDPTGQYATRWFECMDPCYSRYTSERIADHVSFGKHSTDLFSDVMIDFLKNYHGDKPFYGYLAFMAPHDPRTMPKKYLEMYDLDKIELPPNFMTEHPFDYGINIVRDEILCKMPRDPQEIKEEIQTYYAMVTHADEAIGRVLDALRESGEYDNTIIIFSSDNGLAVGQHSLLGKQSCYEHSIRVPLMMAGPGIPRGQVVDSYVYLMDIFPTICDMIGEKIPEGVDGISFAHLFERPEERTREYLFSLFGDKVRSIKDYRYKLIEYKYADMRKTQLFDLEKDPWELNDLSYDKNAYDKIYELRDKLKATALEWDDLESPEGDRFWHEYQRVEIEPEG